MGGAVFTPKQQNWQWWNNNAAEPTSSKAAENTTVTLSTWQEVCRLRVCINDTGGKAANNIAIDLEYSTNDSSFTAFGAANHWDYYDGLATEGNTVTGYKLTDPPDTAGEYSESAGGSVAWDFPASAVAEFDICIQHTSTATASQIYYFRVKIDGTEVPLNTGEAHPNLTTTTAPVSAAVSASYKQFNRTGISSYGIGGLKI